MAEVTERDREAANRLFFLCGSLGDFDAACAFLAEWREARMAEERAAREKAEQERDEAQRIIGLQQAALDVWKKAHPHEANPKPHQERDCLEAVQRGEIAKLRKDLDRKDHEYAEQKSNAEAAEARLRAVIEAADRLAMHMEGKRTVPPAWELLDLYRKIRDASPEPVCALPWSQHGGRDVE